MIKLHSTNWFQFFVDNLHNVVSCALLSRLQTKASLRIKGTGALVSVKKSEMFWCVVSSASAHLQIKASTSPQGPAPAAVPLAAATHRFTNKDKNERRGTRVAAFYVTLNNSSQV